MLEESVAYIILFESITKNYTPFLICSSWTSKTARWVAIWSSDALFGFDYPEFHDKCGDGYV